MTRLRAGTTVEPMATAAGVAEVAFAVDGINTVKSKHASWSAKGLNITQTRMDIGFTLGALDPDGHRLRVFAPSTASVRAYAHRPSNALRNAVFHGERRLGRLPAA